jgi:hypothetical protein
VTDDGCACRDVRRLLEHTIKHGTPPPCPVCRPERPPDPSQTMALNGDPLLRSLQSKLGITDDDDRTAP